MASDPTVRTAASAPAVAAHVPPRKQATLYPAPFAERMAGREKRTLGDLFGLKSFGVNLTSLAPGAMSSIKHRHSAQDEFVFVVSGTITLVSDDDRFEMPEGTCAGFPARGASHHLVNNGASSATYLEIGDRNPGDEVEYPDDDLQVRPGPDGRRRYEHKDGTPY